MLVSLAELCLVRTRSDVQLRAEMLALRHQLRVLERKLGRPRWRPGKLSQPSELARFFAARWNAVVSIPVVPLAGHRGAVSRDLIGAWFIFDGGLSADLLREPDERQATKHKRRQMSGAVMIGVDAHKRFAAADGVGR